MLKKIKDFNLEGKVLLTVSFLLVFALINFLLMRSSALGISEAEDRLRAGYTLLNTGEKIDKYYSSEDFKNKEFKDLLIENENLITAISKNGILPGGDIYFKQPKNKKTQYYSNDIADKWNALYPELMTLFEEDATFKMKKKVVLDSTNQEANLQSLVKENKKFLAAEKAVEAKWPAYLAQLSDFKTFLAKELKAKENEFFNSLWISLGLAIFGFIILFFLFRGIFVSPVQKIADVSEKIAEGSLSEKIEYSGKNEFAQISGAINRLVAQLKSATDFVRNIGDGKLDSRLELAEGESQNEEGLAKALITMQQKMQQVAREDKERNWVTGGLAKFVDILRTNNDDIASLGDKIVTDLVGYVNALQGAMFIVDNDEEDQAFLRLVACYAYDRKKYLNKNFGIGEGLVGQCYLEMRTIHMTEIPDDYAEITSGLGTSKPKAILIVPLKVNDEIQGILELASMQEFKSYEIEFVEKLAESIASQISGVKTNERTRKLLEDSQELTEQMRAQEEEMRQNNEELMATQEEMQRKAEEIENRVAALDESGIALAEFDLRGNFTGANDSFENLIGMNKEQLEGKNEQILLPDDEETKTEFKTTWKKLLSGTSVSGIFKRCNGKGESIYLSGAYSALVDHNNKPYKIVQLTVDITAQKKQEEQIALKNSEMLARLESLEKSGIGSIEFTPDGHVIYANEAFLQLMQYSMLEIKGKHHRIFVEETEAKSDEYKTFWEKRGRGESFIGTFKRVKKDGSYVYIKGSYYAIHDSEGNVIKIVKVVTDVTEAKKQEELIQKQLQEAKQREEEMRAQEEEIRQNMEELQATQDELAKRNAEIEAVREKEKKRADEQIQSQKKIMQSFVEKSKQKEQQLLKRIEEFEKEEGKNGKSVEKSLSNGQHSK